MAMLHGTASSRLELSFECSKLADADLLSKSDPAILLFSRGSMVASWDYLGQTETVRNNLNPKFTTPIVVDFFFEEVQYLKLEVIDVDKTGQDGRVTGDLLGTHHCRLADIVGAKGCTLVATLVSKRSKKSVIKILSEETSSVKGAVVFQLRGTKLANRDGWFGKSDPFFTLAKAREDGQWVNCATSGVVMNNLSPTWPALKVPVRALCNGDQARPLLLTVADYDKDDVSTEIGHMTVNTQALLTPGWSGKLQHPKGKAKDVGTVSVVSAQLIQEPTFYEYLAGGLELGLSVAIDFTASNGAPSDPRSLHFASNDPNRPNPYEVAIECVGAVLAPYDLDGSFPCYGYGAQMPTGQVSHCFALNGNPAAPGCAGVEGIRAAYKQALRSVSLSGPTCFAPVITAACSEAEASARGPPLPLKYHVLLIITDGAIMDMNMTVDALVRGSRAPLSVIIVGVGEADFSAMNDLDCDGQKLRGSSGVAVRDIVQFVKMKDYAGLGSGARLARDVLVELPDQVTGYFMACGKPPPPPLPRQSFPPA